MSGRFSAYALAALASAWILVPIYLLTVSALGGE
jgi:hypothetical protein